MTIFEKITRPTLLLNRETALKNLQRIHQKAIDQSVRFRPHFKTHMSALIGEWHRLEGIKEITVSSVEMAEYFAVSGWKDILIAFPTNLRQIEKINNLAASLKLGILVDAPEIIPVLGEHIRAPLDLWIEVDTGYGRSGLPWKNILTAERIIRSAEPFPNLQIKGLLTHTGDTYQSSMREEIIERYKQSIDRMNELRSGLEATTGIKLEVSVGDTPGCVVSPKLGDVDEIRPGNYIFFDAMQLHLGVCKADEIAIALACPVVSAYPERNDIVIYGGAIHLSKDSFVENGIVKFGYVTYPENDGWGQPIQGAYVRSLSQEHGILHMETKDLRTFKPGDLVCVLPAHSCLTVDAMRSYVTLDGEHITTINS